MNNQESLERNVAYHKALSDSGRRFIRLKLLNPYKTRIKAIKTLEPTYGIGEFGLLKVDLHEGSNELRFAPNESRTEMVVDVLDCEFNRSFLASHTAYRYWEIVDQKDREEIYALADEIAARNIRVKKETRPPEQIMSDDQLEDTLARLQKEKLDREIKRTESRRPVILKVAKESPDEPDESDPIESVQPEEKRRQGRHAGKKPTTRSDKGIIRSPVEEPKTDGMVTVITPE